MANYTGCKCPVCQQLFTENDDVVVCPECGAPYHRDCYHKNAGCVFVDRHSAGFEWKPAPGEGPALHIPAQEQAAGPEIACPACGAMNPENGLFCESCGAALRKGAPTYTDGKDPRGAATYGPNSVPQPDPFGLNALPPEMKIHPEDEIDGIKAKDWAAFLGKNATYYLLNFKRMGVTGQKISASFSAFLFGPFYFLYRKMWGFAALFFGLRLVLFDLPAVLQMLINLQSPVLAGWDLDVLQKVLYLLSALSFVVRFIQGTFAVYWYKQTAAKRIRAAQARAESADPAPALTKCGGVNLTALVISLSAYFVIYTALCYWILEPLLLAAMGGAAV